MDKNMNNVHSTPRVPACTFITRVYKKRNKVECLNDKNSKIASTANVEENDISYRSTRSNRTTTKRTARLIRETIEQDFDTSGSHTEEDEWCPPVHTKKSVGHISTRPRGRPRKYPVAISSDGDLKKYLTVIPTTVNGEKYSDSISTYDTELCTHGSIRKPTGYISTRPRGRPRKYPAATPTCVLKARQKTKSENKCKDLIESNSDVYEPERRVLSTGGIKVLPYFESKTDPFVGEQTFVHSRCPRLYHAHSKHDSRGLITLRLVRLNVRQIDQLLYGPSHSYELNSDEENIKRHNIWSALRNFDFGDNYVRFLCCKRGLVVETPYQTGEDRRNNRNHNLTSDEHLGWHVRLTIENMLLRISACPERISGNDEEKWDTKRLKTIQDSYNQTKVVKSKDRIYSIDLRDEVDKLASGQMTSNEFVDFLLLKCNEIGHYSSTIYISSNLESDHTVTSNFCAQCRKEFNSKEMLTIHMQTFHRQTKCRKTKVKLPYLRSTSPIYQNNLVLPLLREFNWSTSIKVTPLKIEIIRFTKSQIRPWCFVDGSINMRSIRHISEMLSSWVMFEPGVCIDNLQMILQRLSHLAVLSKKEILELACALKCTNYFRAVQCTNASQHKSGFCNEVNFFAKRPSCRLVDITNDQCEDMISNVDNSCKSVFWYVNDLAQFDCIFEENH